MPITEVKDPDQVHLGLGVLGLASFPQGSPPAGFTDVGYLKGMSLAYNRELKDFESAGLLVKRLAFRDRLTATSEWAEISVGNLNTLLPQENQGMGQAFTGPQITFGGSRAITRFAMRFESLRDDNKYITIDIFKCTPAGEFRLAFAEEEFITYPVEFAAEADTSRPTGKQYGRIRIDADNNE